MKTDRALADSSTHFQHRKLAIPDFTEQIFDEQWLHANGYVHGRATAGRGGTWFLCIDEQQLVLRHYRRGGMVRAISKQSYIWSGLHNTRAWREFAVLSYLEQCSLPAPRAYACRVQRNKFTYTASLITYFLHGETLASKLKTQDAATIPWERVGSCIRRFHVRGVNHVDLNAHNILLDQNNDVSLIDFDRARIEQPGANSTHGSAKWMDANLERFRQSMHKINPDTRSCNVVKCCRRMFDGYHSSVDRTDSFT